MTKYWMVHKKGTSTSYMHDTLESALEEAKRLCRQGSGEFYVLEAVKHVQIPVEINETVAPVIGNKWEVMFNNLNLPF